MPERPMSAYIFYANEMIPLIKKKDKISHQEAIRLMGGKWHALTDVERFPYLESSKKD
jgi:hypothetical protein